ncbi:hypothetical protein L0Z13_19600 [Burkholderia multivorans]|uniref:hypothetical protein n=1 Tax=Burkholderia multivorans TaxID=87883 RepID=UPI000277D3B8|nr:hypothetical protein [Burkholderia multivorans]AVR18339.1 hypothetical protein A8H40_02205 [Burkholderia multivorans]EJO54041.1 hypothetical protein BURMUCF1_A2122 [Burkholderia multivorans ATCC BAA-247]MBU9494632.1 hypothetical protein [Burkholderia multivorans]UQO09123.1 hypothetical protein L0Z13_19600 [Burkholderia multivorans]UQP31762.1 hypothetical protein L0Y84_03160 [Burkholderia multivorans]
MTESVTTPRSRSRSDRSSTRARQRSAAAAPSVSAAAAQPERAAAADAARDERTLDLFGDPVFARDDDVSAAGPSSRDDDARASAPTAERGDGSEGDSARQATLDGFEAEAAVASVAGADEMTAPTTAALHEEDRDGMTADVQKNAVHSSDGVAANETVAKTTEPIPAAEAGANDAAANRDVDAPAAHASTRVLDDVAASDVAATRVADAAARNDESAPNADNVTPAGDTHESAQRNPASVVDDVPVAEAIAEAGVAAASAAADAIPSTQRAEIAADATRATPAARRRSEPSAPKARRAASASARRATDDVPEEPVTTVAATAPADPQSASDTRSSAERPADGSATPASAATFVTKPSIDTSPTAPDTRGLVSSDRLAALQADVTRLTHSADREKRRVNRLLLALAIVVLATLVALIMQTRQIAHLKQDAAAQQLRIDRLAADLSTQQASVMTLQEHHEALLSQVDRLQRAVSRDTAAKRVRRAR